MGIHKHAHECACMRSHTHTLLVLRHYFSLLVHLMTCSPCSRVPYHGPPPVHFLSCFHLGHLVVGLLLKSVLNACFPAGIWIIPRA